MWKGFPEKETSKGLARFGNERWKSGRKFVLSLDFKESRVLMEKNGRHLSF